MATIRKREKSYQIRVSCGYDTNGNQVEQSMTWRPDPKMTPKQIEKELNRQAVMFEEACANGHTTAAIKFQDFAEQWFKEYAEIKLKAQTLRCYHNFEKRVTGLSVICVWIKSRQERFSVLSRSSRKQRS